MWNNARKLWASLHRSWNLSIIGCYGKWFFSLGVVFFVAGEEIRINSANRSDQLLSKFLSLSDWSHWVNKKYMQLFLRKVLGQWGFRQTYHGSYLWNFWRVTQAFRLSSVNKGQCGANFISGSEVHQRVCAFPNGNVWWGDVYILISWRNVEPEWKRDVKLRPWVEIFNFKNRHYFLFLCL